MPARIQNASQNVFNKPLTCQRGQKMCLNMCLPKPHMPAKTGNASLQVWPKPSKPEKTKFILKCVDETNLIRARTENISRLILNNLPHLSPRNQNTSQHELTQPITYQQGYKVYINMCLNKTPHARKDRKCISTFVDQTNPMPTRTQNVSQLEMTIPDRKHNMYLNMCWKNTSLASEDKKCINMCWKNPSHASEDKECISTWIHPSPSKLARKQNVSQNVLTKPISCQQEDKMHLNLC